MSNPALHGYRMGDATLPPSAIDDDGMDRLRQSLLLQESDITALREARTILEPRVEELLDVWYGFVGGHDFLLASFSTPNGPDADYLQRVRGRFGQWVLDATSGDFGPEFRAYQAEVGRRHTASKNATDGVQGAPDVVRFRYVLGLVYPIYATVRPFLESGARDAAHLEQMHQAWLKVVLLSVILWSEAYVPEAWF